MGIVRLLLDSCTFLWLALEPDRLSPKVISLVNDEANSLFMSQISSWEIALKHTAQKLFLPDHPKTWIPSRQAFFGIEALVISESAIFTTCDLPLLHRDPFDRLLIAISLESGCTILSPDTKLDLLGSDRIW